MYEFKCKNSKQLFKSVKKLNNIVKKLSKGSEYVEFKLTIDSLVAVDDLLDSLNQILTPIDGARLIFTVDEYYSLHDTFSAYCSYSRKKESNYKYKVFVVIEYNILKGRTFIRTELEEE